MKKVFGRALLFLFAVVALSSSNTSVQRKQYIDLAIIQNQLFALTSRGTIDILDAGTYAIIDTGINAKNPITKLSVDKKERLFVIENNSSVEIFDHGNLSFTPISTTNAKIYDIVFDSKNNRFLITSNGISDVSTGKIYLPDSSFRLNSYVKQWGKPRSLSDFIIWC